ncbi:MAG: adenylate/guanylate cyclase domain-containing protein [Solirubrobacteraceae bacterium]
MPAEGQVTGTRQGGPDQDGAQVHSEEWRRLLTDGHAPLVRARHLFRYVPSAPRCKVCNNPFGGLGGRAFAIAGFAPSRKNPNLCSRCCDSLPVGGAEVDVAVLFADVRGSTALGEGTAATEFATLLNRFYVAATDVLLRYDAVIDKLIGDEVMAFFVRGIAGEDYRRRAELAGVDLLRAVGYDSREGPWLRLAVAVNAGPAYVGNVGGAVVDFTALGDTVNVAGRLQQHAAAGEVLVADAVSEQPERRRGRRTVALPGRQEPVDVVVLSARDA